MTKLFISYRSLDSKIVDACLEQIEALKDEHGNPRYTVWIDRRSIPIGKDWWQSIVKGIRSECEVFVFMVSQESVRSENCRVELHFARQLNRPIMPIVLPEAYDYNLIKDKRDLKIADQDIPEELKDGRFQFLFYRGSGFAGEFDRGLQGLLKQGWREFPVPDDPADPTLKETGITTIADYYAEGVDVAWKTNFPLAEKHFQRVANSSDLILKDDAHHWMDILRSYQQMANFHAKPATRYKVTGLWQAYIQMFGKLPADFREGVFGDEPFDPKKLNPNQGLPPPAVTPPPPPTQVVTPPPSKVVIPPLPPPPPRDPLAEKLTLARTFTGKRNTDWKPIIVRLGELVAGTPMPKLEMCLVPVGAFKMGAGSDAHPQTITTPYWIARYTVTNAQWREGVQGGAVKVPEWTTWYDAMADCPVAAVTWHQALAFAQWAGCTLPSELETEYAGRGVESWTYPWGNKYDAKRVVGGDDPTYGKKHPAPVTYKPEGASWVGAMQLSGNVWQWQRSLLYTDYPYQAQDGRENVNASGERILRGGSWYTDNADRFRCGYRLGPNHIRAERGGCRLALS